MRFFHFETEAAAAAGHYNKKTERECVRQREREGDSGTEKGGKIEGENVEREREQSRRMPFLEEECSQ